jgi:hypothetical protein
MMMVKGRVHVEAPKGPLRLGEANAIDVQVVGPALLHLTADQRRDGVMVEGGGQDLTLEKRPDGSTYVEVKPVTAGRIGIGFFAVFADGGYERDDIEAEVKPAGPPQTLGITGPAVFQNVIHLNLSPQGRTGSVGLKATYAGVAQPVYYAASEAQTAVRLDEGEPAIRFDAATGKVEALRIGHALITARLDGVAASVCVSVEESENYQRADCSELEPGGSGVAAIAQGADAPGALPGSKLPYTATDFRLGRFAADDRVTVTAPAGGLELAKEAEFTLEAHGPAIARLECRQGGMGSCARWTGQRPGMGRGQDVPWTLGPDGRGTVSVFPTSLLGPAPYTGSPEYTFVVYFADGGVAVKTVKTRVTIGSVAARPCPQGGLNPDLPVRLAAPENGAKQFPSEEELPVIACYDGIQGGVIVSPQFVNYAVETEGGAHVVDVDAQTGKATAVAPGEALVVEKFGGQQWAKCVVVAPRDQMRDLSNCRSLRKKYGSPLAPVEAKVEPPSVIVTEEEAAAQNARARVGVFGQIGVPRGAGALPDLDAITYGTLSPEARDRFAADDRLEIAAPSAAVELGVETKIAIGLRGPEPLMLGLSQQRTRRYSGGPAAPLREVEREEYAGPGRIFREDDGSLAIRVVPHEMGKATFAVTVLFADGGVAARSFDVTVAPPRGTLHLFNAIEDDGPEMPAIPASTLHLLLAPPGNLRLLFPFVAVDGGPRPMALAPRDVSLTAQQAADPVIRLDAAAGTVTALRAGHALVRMRFDGAEAETCVVVQASATPGDPSNCEELRGKQMGQ